LAGLTFFGHPVYCTSVYVVLHVCLSFSSSILYVSFYLPLVANKLHRCMAAEAGQCQHGTGDCNRALTVSGAHVKNCSIIKTVHFHVQCSRVLPV